MLPASKNSTSFWFPPDFSWLNVVVIPMPSANDIGKSWYRVHTLQNMSIFTSIVNPIFMAKHQTIKQLNQGLSRFQAP
jgi:hypothetical protein